jgi:hypothetical protein
LCAFAFILWSKFNPLVVFALDLMSTYEGEHTIFFFAFTVFYISIFFFRVYNFSVNSDMLEWLYFFCLYHYFYSVFSTLCFLFNSVIMVDHFILWLEIGHFLDSFLGSKSNLVLFPFCAHLLSTTKHINGDYVTFLN